MTQTHVTVRGLASTELRTAQFEGVEHLVVPVVALIGDTVVHGMNAPAPELVPANELAASTPGWNGRPVLPDHPGAGTLSANEPELLETQRIGHVFNSRFEDKKLKVEAWIDPARALAADGGEAVLSALRAGDMVEVSIGAYVTAERRSGSLEGQQYSMVWTNIVPDHLAMGLNGMPGACSTDMGCGAPRVNAAKEVLVGDNKELEQGAEVAVETHTLDSSGSIPDPATILFNALIGEAELSHDETMGRLADAIGAVEPNLLNVVDVFSSSVIYATYSDASGLKFFARDYEASPDGVNLGERSRVDPKLSYTPRANAAVVETEEEPTNDTEMRATGACPCTQAADSQPSPGVTAQEGGNMPENTAAVDRLIACAKTPFTDADRDGLAALSAESLDAIEASYAESAPEPEPGPANMEAWLAEAPPEIQRIVERNLAEEAARRTTLITRLLEAQGAYSEEALLAKTTEDLTALGQALKIDEPKEDGDYAGRFTPSTLGAALPKQITNPPDPWKAAIERRQARN